MQINNRFKKVLPHLTAVIIFLAVSAVYFYPVLEGKVLRGNDATVSKINSKEIQDFRDKYGKEPLWTNSIFSGMPAYLISTKYPGNLIKNLDVIHKILKMPISVLFISMIGFYILLLMFGVDPWLSITGALAYGLSSFFFQILLAGHNTQAIALAYMPPMIGSIYYAYRRDALKGALMAAFFLALELQANHPQITYYAIMCLLVWGIVEFIWSYKNKTVIIFLKTSALLIIPFVIAILINFASLYTTYEYGKYSIRGKSDLKLENKNTTSGLEKNYILAWSYGVDETFNLLIPDYKGGASKPFDRNSETFKVLRQNNAADAISSLPKYWGTQSYTEGPHYIGAVIIFLFILGIFLVKGPEKWWLVSATVLAIMLAWGRNFLPLSNLFIEIFPGYNKFRAVTMILVIAQFCIPLLGILALRDIFNGTASRKEILKGLKWATGITGGFILLVLLIPGIAGSFLMPHESAANGYPAWLTTALASDRKMLLRTDGFRSLVLILLSAGIILAFLHEKIRMHQAVVLATLLIVIDLWGVDKRYLNADKFERPAAMDKIFTPSPADAFILKDKSYYRVLNLAAPTFNDNTPTSYFHKSVGGYHGAKMKRYQEFIDSSLTRDIDLIGAASSNAKSIDDFRSVFSNTNGLNMVNAKYVIYQPSVPPLINQNALGNAWFVEKPVFMEDANQEISSLKTFNPSKEALIDRSFRDQISKEAYPADSKDSIYLTSYLPNELKYKYSAGQEKLAVFSDIYYPAGWKAFIDGKESRYFRTDYLLRGMAVPAGEHEIRFSFEPASYIIGNKISLAGSILLILLIAAYFASYFYKRTKGEKLTEKQLP